jgi:hypothetical protein
MDSFVKQILVEHRQAELRATADTQRLIRTRYKPRVTGLATAQLPRLSRLRTAFAHTNSPEVGSE